MIAIWRVYLVVWFGYIYIYVCYFGIGSLVILPLCYWYCFITLLLKTFVIIIVYVLLLLHQLLNNIIIRCQLAKNWQLLRLWRCKTCCEQSVTELWRRFTPRKATLPSIKSFWSSVPSQLTLSPPPSNINCHTKKKTKFLPFEGSI